MQEIFSRVELLFDKEGLQRIKSRRIILFGVGGVGSWCAESLVRTGITNLTIVDFDDVNPSNINRQLMATTRTIGMPKVEALRERLLEINPNAHITAICEVYSEATNHLFNLSQYHYIIDCIDSLKDKMALLHHATATPAKVFSSMGAALKVDPTQIKVAELWKVRGCPLGAALRKKMKQKHILPAQKVMCVYSEELLQNKGQKGPSEIEENSPIKKVQTNGSLSHITGIFGFTIAGMIIHDIVTPQNQQS